MGVRARAEGSRRARARARAPAEEAGVRNGDGEQERAESLCGEGEQAQQTPGRDDSKRETASSRANNPRQLAAPSPL